jgi:hypothetical protein
MKRFRIKITSGEHADRYLGHALSSGLVASEEMQNDPPVDIPRTNYGSYARELSAIQFFEHGAYEAFVKLRALGYELEMEEVKGRACGAD